MKEMTIRMPEPVKLKINGHIFQLQKSDVEILHMVQDAKRKYEGRNISGVDGALEAARRPAEDDRRHSWQGRYPKAERLRQAGLAFSYHMLTEIAQGAVEACAQALEEAYA